VFACDWWIAAAKVLAFEVVRDGDATSDARILSLKFVLIKRPPAKGESSHLLAAASRSESFEQCPNLKFSARSALRKMLKDLTAEEKTKASWRNAEKTDIRSPAFIRAAS